MPLHQMTSAGQIDGHRNPGRMSHDLRPSFVSGGDDYDYDRVRLQQVNHLSMSKPVWAPCSLLLLIVLCWTKTFLP